jgi:predicted phosphoribosyltransferase
MRDYADRLTAGRQLAQALQRLHLKPPLVVLGLARGGVPVAVPVARALHAPLDVMLVRKLAAPWQPEFALGAIAPGGVVVRDTSDPSLITPEEFEAVLAQQTHELERRGQAYRAARPEVQLRGSTVVLVDDGLATGYTMLAAVRSARGAGAARIVVACPVGSLDARALIAAEADDVMIPLLPREFSAVGEWYRDFEQVDDAEVRRLLLEASRGYAASRQITGRRDDAG